MNLLNLFLEYFTYSVNLLSVLVVFFYSCNKLSSKKWGIKKPELWVHTSMIASSLALFLYTIDGALPFGAQALFNISIAFYFILRRYRWYQQVSREPSKVN